MSFSFAPIAIARTPFTEPMQAPRQPRAAEGVRGTIELEPGLEDALADLDAWDRIWVIFVFDRAQGWRPKVLPPRSEKKRGVFATRAPHRPNPIGMSVLRLEAIEGRVLHVLDVDLLDGTPILDIKPYVAWTDAIPEASGGWLGERPSDPQPDFEVVFRAEARSQLEFLREHEVDLEPAIAQVLRLGPQPHAYRRIRPDGEGLRLALKDWRVRFVVEGRRIEVTAIGTGYRPAALFGGGDAPALHRRYVERFGGL